MHGKKGARDTVDGLTRRRFLQTSAVTSLGLSAGLREGAALAGPRRADTVRVGVVGCGGRGTGAARDAVGAAPDVEVVAMGDLFEDRLERSRALLHEAIGDAYKVDDEHAFAGFDAYQSVIDCDIDIVILATPPGFRPRHFRAAVEAGRHVFMEKPAAVDVAGVRAIVEAGTVADEKGLSVATGTIYRRAPHFVETVERIHDGLIGELLSAQAYYLTGELWLRERKPGMSDMEWQCRNWYYFTWLSGDHIVEQFIHNIDVMSWIFQSPPESCLGMGGRIRRVDPSYGHIYDHFSIEYAYAGGARLEAKCRQMDGCARRVTNRIVGTRGIADLAPSGAVVRSTNGDVLLEAPESEINPFVQEHADLIASVRDGTSLNESRQVAESTLMAIMGRESAYTGQQLSWEEVATAGLDLVPRSFEFGRMPFPPVAEPGVTTLERAPWARDEEARA